jgi:GNAT superfamily N-acetyltransferase
MVKEQKATTADIAWLRDAMADEKKNSENPEFGVFNNFSMFERNPDDALFYWKCEERVGAALFADTDDKVKLDLLWVVPEWRGNGIGGEILALIEERAFTQKRMAFLSIHLVHQVAVKFYAKYGYKKRSETPENNMFTMIKRSPENFFRFRYRVDVPFWTEGHRAMLSHELSNMTAFPELLKWSAVGDYALTDRIHDSTLRYGQIDDTKSCIAIKFYQPYLMDSLLVLSGKRQQNNELRVAMDRLGWIYNIVE